MSQSVLSPRQACLLAALAAALALGIALASEHFAELIPCPLCLWERHPYRAAIVLGAIGALLPNHFARLALWLVALAMLAALVLGIIHVGVEWKLWPSPLPACAAPDFSGLSITERLARMPATPAKPCDEPTYLIPFLPLSMAMMNLLYAAALLAFSIKKARA